MLRVIAAIAVISAHYFWSYDWITKNLGDSPEVQFGWITHFSRYGFLGVHLFFVISGIVITKTCIGRSCFQFISARLLRIMPIYVFSILIAALVYYYESGSESILCIIFSNVLFIPSLNYSVWLNPVYWSLGIEVSFYFLIALIIVFFGTSSNILWKSSWMSLALSILKQIYLPEKTFSPIFDYWAPFFIGGMLIFLADSFKKKMIASAGIFSCAILGYTAVLETADMEARSKTTIAIIVGAIFIMSALSVWVGRFAEFSSSHIAFLGLLSYPVYLLHVIPGRNLAEFFIKHGFDWKVSYSIGLLSTLLLSILAVLFLEEKIKRRISRFGKPRF